MEKRVQQALDDVPQNVDQDRDLNALTQQLLDSDLMYGSIWVTLTSVGFRYAFMNIMKRALKVDLCKIEDPLERIHGYYVLLKKRSSSDHRDAGRKADRKYYRGLKSLRKTGAVKENPSKSSLSSLHSRFTQGKRCAHTSLSKNPHLKTPTNYDEPKVGNGSTKLALSKRDATDPSPIFPTPLPHHSGPGKTSKDVSPQKALLTSVASLKHDSDATIDKNMENFVLNPDPPSFTLNLNRKDFPPTELSKNSMYAE